MESTTTPQAERLADLISSTERDLANVEDDLRRQVASLRKDLANVVDRLDAGHHISERGELQNSALRFDMTCQRRQLLAAQLEQLRFAAQEG